MGMFTGAFWRGVAERALKSAGQGGLIYLGTLVVQDLAAVNLLAVDWRLFLGFAGGMALLSVVTSVASAPVGPTGSPSLVGEPAGASPGRHRPDQA